MEVLAGFGFDVSAIAPFVIFAGGIIPRYVIVGGCTVVKSVIITHNSHNFIPLFESYVKSIIAAATLVQGFTSIKNLCFCILCSDCECIL